MNWILENIQWIFPTITAGISTVWAYFTRKDKKKLELALEKVRLSLQETEADAAHVALNEKVNKAVDAALDRALKMHASELDRLNASYTGQIALLKEEIITAKRLRSEAVELASTYEALIDKLKKYNNYLKGVLDENGIKYKEEDEI